MKTHNWYKHLRRNLQSKWDSVDKKQLSVEERLSAFEEFMLDELAMTKHQAIDYEFRFHPQSIIE